MKKALIVMAKRPFPGRTKTRLCPPLSHQEAALLYENFLKDTLANVRSLPGVTPFVAWAPDGELAYFQDLAPGFELIRQQGDSLGPRLDAALTFCGQQGFQQVAAVSSDAPSLPAAFLQHAFASLDDPDCDVVLGPCQDGGYYLIGWKQPHPRLVREVPMSTATVLQDTLRLAEEDKLTTTLLPVWYDIDEFSDVTRLMADLESTPEVGVHTRRFLKNQLNGRGLE